MATLVEGNAGGARARDMLGPYRRLPSAETTPSVEQMKADGYIVNVAEIGTPVTRNRTFLGFAQRPDGTKDPTAAIFGLENTTTIAFGQTKTAGKTESIVRTNARLSTSPTLLTSSKVDIAEKDTQFFLAQGRTVKIVDPSGEFERTHKTFLANLGVQVMAVSSPLIGAETYDGSRKQSERMVAPSKMAQDHGQYSKFWEGMTTGVLSPLLLACNVATPEILERQNVRSKMELLNRLGRVEEANMRVAMGILADQRHATEGRGTVLLQYAQAREAAPDSDAMQLLVGMFKETNADHVAAGTVAKIADVGYEAAKGKADANTLRTLDRFHMETLAEIARLAAIESPTDRDRLRYERVKAAEGIASLMCEAAKGEADEKTIETINQYRIQAHAQVIRYAGGLNQIRRMGLDVEQGGAPLSPTEAREQEYENHLTAGLIRNHEASLGNSVNMVLSKNGNSAQTVNTYNQMLQLVLDPYQSVAGLKSANVENGRPVVDVEEFLTSKDDVIIVFLPQENAAQYAPSVTTLISSVIDTAIQINADPERRLDDKPLGLLDEVLAFGKIPDLEQKILTLRDSMRLVMVAQDVPSLERLYTKEAAITIATMCHNQVTFTRGANTQHLQNLSTRLGDQGIENISHSLSMGEKVSQGTNSGTIYRAIASPADMLRMPRFTGMLETPDGIVPIDFDTVADLGLDLEGLPRAEFDLQHVLPNSLVPGYGPEAYAAALGRVTEALGITTGLREELEGGDAGSVIGPEVQQFMQDHGLTREQAIARLVEMQQQLAAYGMQAAAQAGIDAQAVPELQQRYDIPVGAQHEPAAVEPAPVREGRGRWWRGRHRSDPEEDRPQVPAADPETVPPQTGGLAQFMEAYRQELDAARQADALSAPQAAAELPARTPAAELPVGQSQTPAQEATAAGTTRPGGLAEFMDAQREEILAPAHGPQPEALPEQRSPELPRGTEDDVVPGRYTVTVLQPEQLAQGPQLAPEEQAFVQGFRGQVGELIGNPERNAAIPDYPELVATAMAIQAERLELDQQMEALKQAARDGGTTPAQVDPERFQEIRTGYNDLRNHENDIINEHPEYTQVRMDAQNVVVEGRVEADGLGMGERGTHYVAEVITNPGGAVPGEQITYTGNPDTGYTRLNPGVEPEPEAQRVTMTYQGGGVMAAQPEQYLAITSGRSAPEPHAPEAEEPVIDATGQPSIVLIEGPGGVWHVEGDEPDVVPDPTPESVVAYSPHESKPEAVRPDEPAREASPAAASEVQADKVQEEVVVQRDPDPKDEGPAARPETTKEEDPTVTVAPPARQPDQQAPAFQEAVTADEADPDDDGEPARQQADPELPRPRSEPVAPEAAPEVEEQEITVEETADEGPAVDPAPWHNDSPRQSDQLDHQVYVRPVQPAPQASGDGPSASTEEDTNNIGPQV